MDDTIKKSDAIKAIAEYFSDDDDSHWNAIATYIIKDIPTAEKQNENATRCYEFLKTKLGEGIVDSKKEFESWYERMVWHVKECDKLAREPKQGEWIPCSETLPENIRPVLVTWKNNDPASYYQYIVGKHFIGTAHYHRGKWYWYSSVTEDLLAEYGKCETEEFDEAIEAVAWMPLPKPYGEREGE